MKFSSFAKVATISSMLVAAAFGGAANAAPTSTAVVEGQGTVAEAAATLERSSETFTGTNRVVVTMKSPAGEQELREAGWGFAKSIRGVSISYVEVLSDREVAVAFTEVLNEEDLNEVTTVMGRYVNVESAKPDRMALTETRNTYKYAPDSLMKKQWYLDQIGAKGAWDKGYTGAGVKIAVIDSGYTKTNDTFNYWLGGKDYIADPAAAADGDGVDGNPYDSANRYHGAYVHQFAAGEVNGYGMVGVAPDAKVQHYRVAGVGGVAYGSWVKRGFKDAVNSDARVINISLGSTGSAQCTDFLASEDLQRAQERGKVVVVAAGNKNRSTRWQSPANCDSVIAVGATTQDGTKADFSNYGAEIDLWAPGERLATHKNGTPVLASGTSFSAPQVSGAAAILLEKNPRLTDAQVKKILQDSADRTPAGLRLNVDRALTRF